jgi:hypothetical protein
MYEGLKIDCGDEIELLSHLEIAKDELQDYQQHYAGQQKTAAAAPAPPIRTSSLPNIGDSPQKFSFTARYERKERRVVDEFIEFLKLPREDFDLCKPLEWWRGRRSQFPNLYRLACDIFSIPGKI